MMPNPCTYIIFGATGNLARLKLLPGFYNLEIDNKLPPECSILAVGRRSWDQSRWLSEVRSILEQKTKTALDENVFERFCQRLFYHQGDIDSPECYQQLAERLTDNPQFSKNIAFYLAISPERFGNVIESLSHVDLFNQAYGWRRMVIEKPFGYDLESAQVLQKRIHRYLDESQIFRIDHYLGKGMVQNVLVFRFASQ